MFWLPWILGVVGLILSLVLAERHTPSTTSNESRVRPQNGTYESSYINLDKRTDRKQQIEQQLSRFFSDVPCYRVPGVVAKFGALGCANAQLNQLRDALRRNQTEMTIFHEDDFDYDHDPRPLLKWINSLRLRWSVILFAANEPKCQRTTFPQLARCTDAQTTSCFMVHRDYLPTLIRNFEESVKLLTKEGKPKHDYCVDIYWKRLQKGDRWYLALPLMGHQREDFSDIAQTVVRYTDRNPVVLEEPVVTRLVLQKSSKRPSRLFKGNSSFYSICKGNETCVDEEEHIITVQTTTQTIEEWVDQVLRPLCTGIECVFE